MMGEWCGWVGAIVRAWWQGASHRTADTKLLLLLWSAPLALRATHVHTRCMAAPSHTVLGKQPHARGASCCRGRRCRRLLRTGRTVRRTAHVPPMLMVLLCLLPREVLAMACTCRST